MHNTVQTVARIGTPRLLVVGDLVLDRYSWGSAQRVSPEAPVLVLEADEQESRLGGAASVARLARGLDASVMLVGVIGTDPDGQELCKLLDDVGIDASFVATDPSRPTTVKQRFVGRASGRHAHQILRVDREQRHAIDGGLEASLLKSIQAALVQADALLISDYGKGVCTPTLLQAAIEAAHDLHLPVVIDPARGVDYRRYSGADLLTPNRPEAEQAASQAIQTPQHALTVAYQLCESHSLDAVLVTLDRQGMALCRADGTGQVVATRARSVYDVTGAGDMVLATLGLALAAGISLSDGVHLANLAAGLEVERFGIMPVSRSELASQTTELPVVQRKLVSDDEMARLAASYREQGKRVVFTNGCFDLFHAGHAAYLEESTRLGDILVVGVNSDRSVRRLKGADRPVIGQVDRAAILAALTAVDHVVIFDEATPNRLLDAIRPDVLVKGGTYTAEEVVGREVVAAYGGDVQVVGQVPGLSTTKIIATVQSQTPVLNVS